MNSGGTLMSIIDHSGYKMTLGQLMPRTTCYHGSTSSSRSNVMLLDIFILYSVPCMLWKCINEHVYSPNDSKEQTICKTDRQTETDKQRQTTSNTIYMQLAYTNRHIQFKRRPYKNTLNQPVTSRAAQILV